MQDELLAQILEELQLLTVKTKAEAWVRFQKDFLGSPLRKQMYAAFDGVRTLPQISADIRCKVNTLQVFAQDLVDKDLVDYSLKGNAKIIRKSPVKICLYYAKKEMEES